MNKEQTKVELLSPAGSKSSFIAAVQNGADAIYMGLDKYNARQMAQNFNEEEYIDAIHYAHVRGVNVYLTLNTLMLDSEIKDAMTSLIKLYSAGLDAVIVQDIGLANIIRTVIPELHIHASTQMSVHNLKQVKLLEKMGFSRVVLARELSIPEIEYICKNTSMDIEVFIHGALCVSYSGQCLMSSMIGDRSSNRGKCAQPCRMKYSLYDNSGKLIEKEKYILSKKDIFGISYIKRLEKIGVKSLKIEGRGKTPEYVSLVTSKYRKYLDNNSDNIDVKDEKELAQIFNRDGISTGYFEGVRYKEGISLNSSKNTGLVLGQVLEQQKEYVKIKLEEDISMHDGIEIYDNEGTVSTIVTCIKDENFKTVNEDRTKGSIVWIGDISRKVQFDSVIYKTSSSKLNESLKDTYSETTNFKKVPIKLLVNISTKENLNVVIEKEDNEIIKYDLDYIPEVAKSKSIDKEYVLNSFSKTNDTPFIYSDIDINIEENVFVPVSKLNELRRNALLKLYDSYKVIKDRSKIIKDLDRYLRSQEEIPSANDTQNLSENKEALYIYEYDKNNEYLKGAKYDRVYINASDFISYENDIFNKFKESTNIFVAIPNIVNKNLESYIDDNIERLIQQGVKGILIGNIGYIDMANILKEKYDIKLVADYGLNITNTYSCVLYKNLGFDTITMSVEMQKEDIPKFRKVMDTEVVCDYVTVMTSRYCILGSFVGNKSSDSKCSMACKKEAYYLKDSHDLNYEIISDSTDCTMKLVREFFRFSRVGDAYKGITIRRCVL